MKNKESFLKELQNGLAVLAESEQQDILAEYAQHIDMRIAGGLTEEEAIQDFGDIHQLTAEILAAYHVNPAYSRAPGKLPDPRPALSRAWSHTGNFFRTCRILLQGGPGDCRFSPPPCSAVPHPLPEAKRHATRK